MEDDRHPFTLKRDAWKWIDRAVDLAEANGLYTILDMHGAQGGQSPYDHTGHSDQNRLKDSPEDQKRLAWLWGQIAKRYRDRSAVVAYDVWNEPYGTPKPLQKPIFEQALKEIRKVDGDKLVYAMGNFDGFDQYGDPKANGWRNVGFQMHYYPGLFGGGDPTVKTQKKHLEDLEGIAQSVRKLDVPFYVGEMNVVFDAAGGADMMRRTFDQHAGYGWATTMWSYKLQSAEGGVGNAFWGMVANAKPAPQIDFETASKADVEAYFRLFATQELVVNEPLRKALGDPAYRPRPLPADAAKRLDAPQEALAGWSQADVGGPRPGGLEKTPGGFALYGGGRDVWGGNDQFRFLHKAVTGDFTVEATVANVEDVDAYTKAGLMIRASTAPDAPFALLSTFPERRDPACPPGRSRRRGDRGADRQGIVAGTAPSFGPEGWHDYRLRPQGEEWRRVASIADRLPKSVLVGPIACSHDDSQLVKVDYRNLTVAP